MRVLLDTHTLLWFLNDSRDMSRAARQVLAMRSTEAWVSVISVWEIAIKVARGWPAF